MVPPSPNVRRHFLPWDRPLLTQAVTFLSADWKEDGPLDLAHLLVIVPTRQSGRRLREALAAHAATRHQAAFPPRVLTPDALMATEPTTGVASRLESLLTWAEVFRALDLDDFRQIFPVDPPDRNFGWALRLAQDFARLQGVLAEAGLTLADVPARAGGDFPEVERWQQIARLERRHAESLAVRSLRDGPAAKIARAAAPIWPEGVNRIVMLAVADPVPLALRALDVHARSWPVDVVVFAPQTDAAAFDGWGRPESETWAKRSLEFAGFEQHVWLSADPGTQAEQVVAEADHYRASEGVLAVGVADAEVLSPLETGLRRVGLAGFNPEGRSRRGDGLFQLLSALAGLARADTFVAVATLVRCPDVLKFLGVRGGANFSAARFLADLDRWHTEHLPPDLTELRRHAPKRVELAAVAELRATLTAGSFPGNAASVLGLIFAGREFNLALPSDALAAEAVRVWTEITRELAGAAKHFRGVENREWWDLALGLYAEEIYAVEKPAGAVELQGWLELLWEDAPHLVVAGLNDGRVPDAIVGDPFLPESLRERLGLKTNAARLARDAYFLQALAKSRSGEGRLDLLLGKTSTAGDPLRPSRLLLRCADGELPQRIAFLFGAVTASRPNPPWRRAWRLEPERRSAPASLAVTGLRAWLDCPFRFYLSRVLKMQPVDPGKTELDELDFGILCHAALEAMGREPGLRDCADASVLREFLLGALNLEAAKQFGQELTLPLLVQLESARQRLARVAEVQAQTRAEGWVIERVEWSFELEIAGLKVRGKIDRIDRHETTGAIRVLDYKTSDKPVNPVEAHWRNVRADEIGREFARVPAGEGREQVWRDLQLPIYLRALAAEYPGEITGGYFNLPKASTETGIAVWEGYSRALAESAWRCAEGVAAAIRAGEFWPPNEHMRAEYDDFATFFHHGVAESVEWKGSADASFRGAEP